MILKIMHKQINLYEIFVSMQKVIERIVSNKMIALPLAIPPILFIELKSHYFQA